MFKEKNYKSTCSIEISDNAEYIKLSDCVGEELNPIGFIIHEKSKYGKSLSLVIDSKTLVNMPSWSVEIFEDFTDEEVEAFKNGKCLITNIEKKTTSNGETTVFSFDDVE